MGENHTRGSIRCTEEVTYKLCNPPLLFDRKTQIWQKGKLLHTLTKKATSLTGATQIKLFPAPSIRPPNPAIDAILLPFPSLSTFSRLFFPRQTVKDIFSKKRRRRIFFSFLFSCGCHRNSADSALPLWGTKKDCDVSASFFQTGGKHWLWLAADRRRPTTSHKFKR